MPHRSHSHRRRSSSVSFSSRPTIIPGGSPYQPVSSIPIPINQPSYSQNGGSPYNTGGSPYNNGGPLYNTGGSPYSNTSPFQGPNTYPQQYPVQGVPVVSSSYDPNQALLYQGAGSYPQQTYIQGQPGQQPVPVPPGSTIYIQQPPQQSSSRHKRHHKHRSGSRDSRRHRSHSDAGYLY